MDDFINREAVRNELYDEDAITMMGVSILDKFPSADVVEVVRCKDCKYSHDHEINRNYRCHRHARDGYSQVFDAKFTDNDFCSYGERKDNENP